MLRPLLHTILKVIRICVLEVPNFSPKRLHAYHNSDWEKGWGGGWCVWNGYVRSLQFPFYIFARTT